MACREHRQLRGSDDLKDGGGQCRDLCRRELRQLAGGEREQSIVLESHYGRRAQRCDFGGGECRDDRAVEIVEACRRHMTEERRIQQRVGADQRIELLIVKALELGDRKRRDNCRRECGQLGRAQARHILRAQTLQLRGRQHADLIGRETVQLVRSQDRQLRGCDPRELRRVQVAESGGRDFRKLGACQ